MKRIYASMLWIVIGAILIVLSFLGKVDEFWNGMGSGLLILGCVQLLRHYRISKNTELKERIEIEEKDERNHYIKNKAWAWAGYLYVMMGAVGCIVLRIFQQNELSIFVSGSVCVMLLLYWGSYHILKKKY